MELRLKDGNVVVGTADEIAALVKAGAVKGDDLLETGEYYNSATRGIIKISGMDINHIRNAMIKEYRNFTATLAGLRGDALLAALYNGPNTKQMLGLYKAYSLRHKSEG